MFSSRRAYAQANIGPDDVDIFELHDAYTIMAVLSLEGAGFARPGEGLWLGVGGEIGLQGKLPVSDLGGTRGARASRRRHGRLSTRPDLPATNRAGRPEPGSECPYRHGPEHRRDGGDGVDAYFAAGGLTG